MPKIVIKEEKRHTIFKALDECLLEKPFNQTTIKDIAKKAGVNHGMLHYYFKSKEDILLKYIDFRVNSIIERNLQKYPDALLSKTPDKITVEEFFTEMFKQVSLNRDLSRVFIEIWSIANYNEKVRQKLQALYQNWREAFLPQVNCIVKNKARASDISLSMVAFFEGVSLFSVLFDQDDFDADASLNNLAKRITAVLTSME